MIKPSKGTVDCLIIQHYNYKKIDSRKVP